MSEPATISNEVWILDAFCNKCSVHGLIDEPEEDKWQEYLIAFELYSKAEICIFELSNWTNKSIFNNSLVITCSGNNSLLALITNEWELPSEVIDIQVEHRLITNGNSHEYHPGLINIVGDFAYSDREIDCILYRRNTFAAVAAISHVFNELVNTFNINYKQAIQRGRYIKALAQLQDTGIPIDYHRYMQLPNKQQVVDYYSDQFDVFSGTSIDRQKLIKHCEQEGIDTQPMSFMSELVKAKELKKLITNHPQLEDLYHISCLLQTSSNKLLATNPNTYRNTCDLVPFGTTTGRNNPRRSEFIYGQPKWMHSFIKPSSGTSLAYIDWNQQEFGIAAALSVDKNMMFAYKSGDPYIRFAIDIAALPSDATRRNYSIEREHYKNALLAIQYGIGPDALGSLLNIPSFKAELLIKQFQSCYPEYTRWCFHQINQARFSGEIRTPFGWNRKINPDTRDNSIKNYPIQAYAAELMRQATCLLVDSGIQVCTSVHDAFLIESSITDINRDIDKAKQLMAQASREALSGFELTSDTEIVSYPNRFSNDEHERIWKAAPLVTRRPHNEKYDY